VDDTWEKTQKTFECPDGWMGGWMEGGRLRVHGWMCVCVCRLMTK